MEKRFRPLTENGQCAKILAHLQSGKFITPLYALQKFGCFRLSGRIWELKQRGFNIVTEIVDDAKSGKRFAKYYIPAQLTKNSQTDSQPIV